MRITNNVMIGNMMKNLQKNMNQMDRLQQQLSSGKQFRFPSQAPIQAARSMNFDSLLNNVEQFGKNIDQANSWMQTTEGALTDANEVLQRSRELTIQGANGTMSATERENVAREVEELRNELLAISEARSGDRYVFSGQSTDQKPFDRNGVYQGDDRRILREINPGVEMQVNVNGREGFAEAIEAMDHLLSDLRGGSARLYGEIGPGPLHENSTFLDSGENAILDLEIFDDIDNVNKPVSVAVTGDETREDLVAKINAEANLVLDTTDETYARVRKGVLEIRSLHDGPDSQVEITSFENTDTNTDLLGDTLVLEEDEAGNPIQVATGGEGALQLSESDISRFDRAIDQNVTTRAELGARMNRLDLTQNRLEDERINLRSLKSENEDVDIAEVIMELRMQESVYQSSLASGARIMQPTLLDFLR